MATVQYWKDIDTLNIVLKKGKYKFSEAISEDVVLDVSQNGEILSIEIQNATKRLHRPLAQKLTHRYMVAS